MDDAYTERNERTKKAWERRCVNLKVQFGDKYRIGLDISAPKRTTDPWHYTIPCKYGEVYPQGGERLAFHCKGGKMRGIIKRKFPNFVVQNWTDDNEAIFVFYSDQFKDLAPIIKPKRKKKVPESEKARLAEIGARTRFLAAKNDSTSVKGETLSESGIKG